MQRKEHATKIAACNLAKGGSDAIPGDFRKESAEQDGDANSKEQNGEENLMIHSNEEDNGSVMSENVQLSNCFQPENELTCKCKCKCSELTFWINNSKN